MNAREAVLARLRASLTDNPAPVEVPRRYGVTRDGDLAGLFTERLLDYGAHVHTDLASALAGADRLLVPADLPDAWLSSFTGRPIVDEALPVSELDAVDAVLTGCAVAIAETGTIVLDAGVGQGRRAISLVPDRHVVVVRRDQIVSRVPAAVRLLAASAARPQTWISGPSATSDIELNRIEGVHGPRRLDVVLL